MLKYWIIGLLDYWNIGILKYYNDILFNDESVTIYSI